MIRSRSEIWEPHYAARTANMRASEIRELLKLLERPGIISFAGGIPDPALFPVEMAREAYHQALGDPVAARALQYSVSEGDPALRDWLAGYMGRRDIACDCDNILITNGSQQALEFLGKALLSRGDTALVAAPTYLGALQAFAAYEPRYDILSLQADVEAGVLRERAEAARSALKFAYVVPDFSNPTGETMSADARRRLLGLARALDIAIIEDTAYEALRYEGAEEPSLLALDIATCGSIDTSRVIYAGSFSKTLTPGLRIGWICASRAVISRLVLVKQASDLNTSQINQTVMCSLAQTAFETQVARARAHYRPKRDAMLAALERHLPADVEFTRPNGGFFVWLTLPEAIDTAQFLERAIAEANVAFVPGQAFYADGRGANTLRLSFSLPDVAAIDEGISRLARLLN